jgi:hypothetical protein
MSLYGASLPGAWTGECLAESYDRPVRKSHRLCVDLIHNSGLRDRDPDTVALSRNEKLCAWCLAQYGVPPLSSL